MKFESETLGTLEIHPDTVITFPQGFIGMEDCKRFSLFHEEKENPIVHWLQSLDQPDITFSVVDPSILGIRYEVTLTDDEAGILKIQNPEDIAFLLIVRKSDDAIDINTLHNDVKANAIAPLVINIKERIGLQKTTVICELVFRNADSQ